MAKENIQLCIDFINKHQVKGLTLDSRQLNKGEVFLAAQGINRHGVEFIAQALKQGCSAIICDSDKKNEAQQLIANKVPVFFVDDLALYVADIAAEFYQQPSQHLKVIGVTGTNGKTSCCHYIAQLLDGLEIPTAVLGTVGNGPLAQLSQSELTTADPVSLQKNLAEFVKNGISHVAMEVSSHALTQQRVKNMQFAVGVFTNLSRDHLDFHGTYANYQAAKLSLFKDYSLPYMVVNLDDPFSQVIVGEKNLHTEVIGYSLSAPKVSNAFAQIWVDGLVYYQDGMEVTIHSPWAKEKIFIPLLGSFNLQNILAALASVAAIDLDLQQALQLLSNIKPVPGRMQLLKTEGNPLVVVDYAHTPDALANALKALQLHRPAQISCVFGCGGDRDKGKRAEMAKIVENFADKIFITNDNPRSEDPEQIFAAIIDGFEQQKPYQVIAKRDEAIASAIAQAQVDDVVLIAGKGHEQYQIIGSEKKYFCDVKAANDVLKNKQDS